MGSEARASERPRLRVVHTSDVHIGWTKGDRGEHHDVCLCPLHGLLDVVATHTADVLLVAGDLFDHGRLSNDVVAASLELLTSADIPVVLIPGNHDVHDETSLWERCAAEVAASGVHLLDDPAGSTVELFGGDLRFWCRAMQEHEPNYRPLADVPPRPDDGWWIVTGHGHHEPNGTTMRSSPLTPEDVAATGADYVALGHWHVRTDVSAGGIPAWYSGAPTGTVTSGTANLVHLDGAEDGVVVEHVPVAHPDDGCK